MKMRSLLILAVLLVVMVPGASYAAILGSAHDLTTLFPAEDQTCVFCHAPHNPANAADGPLWNHETTTAVFTMYGTTVGGNTTDAAPNTPSLRCLSCHDGVTALESYGGAVGATVLTGPAVIGTMLTDDHPISIDLTGLPAGAQTNAESQGIMFYDDAGTDKVECSSCHDPHDTTNTPFLRVTATGSDICAACHTDK